MKSKMKRRMLAIVLCMVIVLSNSSFIFASSGAEESAAVAQEGDPQNVQETQTEAAVQDTPAVLSETTPEATPEATPEPTQVPEVTAAPTEAPQATAEPTQAPEVTAAPEATPAPTEAPAVTVEPTQAPEVTAAPETTPEATPVPTEAPVTYNEAVELKHEFKDENGNVTATVTAQIPAGAFQADASELTMEVTVPDQATAEHVKKLMEESLPEHYMLGDTVLYDIRFKVNGTETESQQPIVITFENQSGITVKVVKKAVVFQLDPADPAVEGDKDELVTITQKNDMIEYLQNSGQSTDNVDDYDLSEITLKEDGTSNKIQMEGRTSTIYGCYAYYEPVQVLTYEDDQVTVTVSAAENGVIPANAELKVVPITEDKETEDQYKDVEKKLQEKAEEEEYEIAGFLAYDITFVDPDGNKTEPNGEVKVSIDYNEAAIPESVSEEDAQNAEVTVLHLEEDEKGEVKEVVDMAQTEKVDVLATTEENKVEKAEVRTESFSKFVVTWTKDGHDNGEYKIEITSHYGYLKENGDFADLNEYYDGKVLPKKWQEVQGKDNQYSGGDYNLNEYADAITIGNKTYTFKVGYITEGWNSSFDTDHKTDKISVNKENNKYYFFGHDDGWYHVGDALKRDGTKYIHIYFVYTVMEELTTVKTVDSTSNGIIMRMINMDGEAGEDNGNYRIWTNSNYKINLGGGYSPGSIKQGLLQSVLAPNGYPVTTGSNTHIIDDNGNVATTYDGTADKNLSTLFSGGLEVNHLFRQDIYDLTGYYEYSSFENYAYLNQSTGEFTVYDQIGTPSNNGGSGNYFYQRGNFMPYNSISADRISTNSNLYDEYGKKLDPDDERYNETLYLTNGTDYQFGMYMEANFIQPRDGIVQQTDDNMRFEFNGDDDLWIYIDGVLILDIGGVHDAHSGYIDFATGEVVIYDSVTSGKTLTRTTTLYELFKEANRMPDSNKVVIWDENKVDDYFTKTEDEDYILKDYSPHKIKMFYMERGRGASNLHMKFNLQVVPEGSVTVAKELDNTDKENYANEEFQFELYIQEEADDSTAENPKYKDSYIPVTKDKLTALGITVSNLKYNGVDTGNTVPWSEDGKTFSLKPDQSVIFSGLKATQKYYVKEVDVESERYDEIVINTTTVTNKDENGNIIDSDTVDVEGSTINVSSTKDSVYQRPMVTFTNNCSGANSRELRITKVMEEGQFSDGTFTFRIKLESVNGGLVNYVGPYYLTDQNGNYYSYENGKLVSQGQTSTVCGNTNAEGLVTGVPVGYTVAVTKILSGTDFQVEEIDPNTGLTTAVYNDPVYAIDNGSADRPQTDGAASGTIKLGQNAIVTIQNSLKQQIRVTKEWVGLQPDQNTKIYVGLYQNGTATNKTLTLNSNNDWSGLFEGLDGSGYLVKELRPVTGTEQGEFVINGSSFIGIEKGSSIIVGEIQYKVDYSEITQDSSIINQLNATIKNIPNWQIVKRSSSKGHQVLQDATFTLTKQSEPGEQEDENVYTGTSDTNGVINWKDSSGMDFAGLFPDGIYILKETKAPTGYQLGEDWTITITNGVPTAITGSQGTADCTSTVLNGVTFYKQNGILTLYYDNTALYDLPSAGGSGIFWYLISGTAFLMAASLILYRMKRKEVLGK